MLRRTPTLPRGPQPTHRKQPRTSRGACTTLGYVGGAWQQRSQSGWALALLPGPLATRSPMTSYLIETVVTLLAVLALAVLVLYAARRAGVGRQSGPLQLVGRLPLDARRAVYLVKVADKIIVIGASEAGLTRLGEVDDAGLDLEVTEGPAFSQVLSGMLKQPRKKNTRVETPQAPKVKPAVTPTPPGPGEDPG